MEGDLAFLWIVNMCNNVKCYCRFTGSETLLIASDFTAIAQYFIILLF